MGNYNFMANTFISLAPEREHYGAVVAAQRVPQRRMVRRAPAAGTVVQLFSAAAAGVVALVAGLIAAQALPLLWEWLIAVTFALVAGWRVNGRGAFIAVGAVMARPMIPPLADGGVMSPADLKAGAWFCLNSEFEAGRAYRRARKRRRTGKQATSPLLREQRRAEQQNREFKRRVALLDGIIDSRKATDIARARARRRKAELLRRYHLPPPKARPIKVSQPLPAPPYARMPKRQRAVVIVATEDGHWRVWPHRGDVVTLHADDLLRVNQVPAPRAVSPGRQGIADQIGMLLKFVADQSGRLNTPETPLPPMDSSPRPNWERFLALQSARRWGLLRIRRRQPWTWPRDLARALIGLDVPLTSMPLSIQLTPLGQRWLDHPEP